MRIKKVVKIFPVFLLAFLLFAPTLSAQGHFEVGFHYGKWSINILKSLIEEGISDAFNDQVVEMIQEEHPDLEDVDYTFDVDFDSSGSNYGFEVRWYPGGENGSFSLGLSVEKTSMTVELPEVSLNIELTENANFQGNANGKFVIKPLSFHLSFRWDILPSSRVHPYITLGFGAATGTALEEAEFSYYFSGDLDIEGEELEHFEEEDSKTLEELKEELEDEGEEFFLPGFIPFIQLNLGLKAEITENIHLLVDAGVWDGFLIRGGLAFRF